MVTWQLPLIQKKNDFDVLTSNYPLIDINHLWNANMLLLNATLNFLSFTAYVSVVFDPM